jgi:hypothetical protein
MMAGKGRSFLFHGVFKSKARAKRHEHSAHCVGCFITKRKVRGKRRFLVLAEK